MTERRDRKVSQCCGAEIIYMGLFIDHDYCRDCGQDCDGMRESVREKIKADTIAKAQKYIYAEVKRRDGVWLPREIQDLADRIAERVFND
jgi:hypothetical protein